MATLAERPVFSQTVDARFSFGAQIAAHWERLGLIGRRAAVTAVGAIFALSCGAAVAGVVRLPADDGAAQPDAMTVQTELPAETAARSYALENPPAYTVASQPYADTASPPDTAPDFTIPSDETTTKVAYTTPSADDEDQAEPADQIHAAVATTDTTPASAVSSTTPAVTAADASGV